MKTPNEALSREVKLWMDRAAEWQLRNQALGEQLLAAGRRIQELEAQLAKKE